MERLIQDLRYGIRTFVRQPAFAVTAVLALSLGIGANTAVFSVVYAVLLKPLPYPNPEALIYVHDTYPAVTFASISAAKYVALRDSNRTLSALAAAAPANMTLTGRGQPEQVPGARVSADLSAVMRVRALLGRWFSREEDLPNSLPVVVLSHGLWQRRFGSSPAIIGTPISLDGQSRTVVGVMPAGYTYPGSTQAWIPLGIASTIAPGGNFLRLAGRMNPGVSVDEVQDDLSRVSDNYNRANNIQRDVKVWPLHEIIVTTNRRALLVLQGAVAFVLLVACANVANLLLARSVQRQREVAIRAAVGAGRARIFRQLLTESVLLSAIGATVGVLLASWLVRLFIRIAPPGFPRLQSIEIDMRMLVFTLAVAVVTGVVFGLAPALRGFRTNPNDGLREAGLKGATGGKGRGASRLLVVSEVALALMLVIGAGLMVKSLLRLQNESLGFDASRVLTFELSLPPARYPDVTAGPFVARVVDELHSIPGVQSAGAINYIPLANFGFNGAFAIEGRPLFPRDTAPVVEFRTVTPGYFGAMRIPFKYGRDFTSRDSVGGRPVVIINQAMADTYWPGEDPVGARVQLNFDPTPTWREIVGVVGSARSWRVNTAPVPETFIPHAQAPIGTMGFVVRFGDTNAELAVPAIRDRIRLLDADLPLIRVRPMTGIVALSAGETRLSSALTTLFAFVGAALASLGIYSVIAYSVAQRTREIGIRVALGADRANVIRLVVGEGLVLAGFGLALGIAGALLLTRTMEALLYEVSPTDPAVLAITSLGLLVTAVLASLVPAIRAIRIEPSVALRTD